MDPLARHDVALVRAANPGPFTLSGTNTWILGHAPAWVVDPGPALEEHVAAVAAEVRRRDGLGAVLLTHDHPDHADALGALRRHFPGAPLVAARGDADVVVGEGDVHGPFAVHAAPGHAPDHLVFAAGRAGFTGDAVLGEGSVFVAPTPGALAGYLAALRRLRSLGLEVLLPGHGPVITDPAERLDGYIAHRLDRERRLVAALADGLRAVGALLDRVWDDAPAALRLAATATLAAHLDKLEEEGRLPPGVERPALEGVWPV